jgi:hypothetical protein
MGLRDHCWYDHEFNVMEPDLYSSGLRVYDKKKHVQVQICKHHIFEFV